MSTLSTIPHRFVICMAALALFCAMAGSASAQRATAPKAPAPSTKATPAAKPVASWPPPALVAAETTSAPVLTPEPEPAAPSSTPAPAAPSPAVAAPAPEPAAPSSAPVATINAPSPTDYRLGAGDKLRIEVYRDAQLSQSVQVRPDGKITLPLIGDIGASGRTPLELDDSLTTALKEYVRNPDVTVIVVEAMAATAHVIGEVNHPGPIVVNTNMTVLQALSLAGGLTDWAKKGSILIQRPGPTGTEIIPFNYKEATSKRPSDPVYIRPGDTIVVPD